MPDSAARGGLPAAAYPRAPPRCRTGHRLFHRALRITRWRSGDHPRSEPIRPRPCMQVPSPPRCHCRRGGCPQAAAGRRAVRIGGPQPGDPLPARTAVAQGNSRLQRRAGARPGRHAVRRLGPWNCRAADLAVTPGPRRFQSSRRLRQPGRHRGQAPGDPCPVVRTRRSRGLRVDRGLRRYRSASDLD